jgi:hypothetical protein
MLSAHIPAHDWRPFSRTGGAVAMSRQVALRRAVRCFIAELRWPPV